MANQELNITTATKEKRKDYFLKHSEALALIFRTDPAIRFITCHLSWNEHVGFLRPYMTALQKGAYLNDGVFQEVGDWSSCAVWMPPGKRVDNFWTLPQAGLVGISLKLGPSAIKKMLWDFQNTMDKLKKKHMKQQGIKKYWYLWFIGTHEEARGKGLASKVVRNFQDTVARKEKLPIWLESTTETSMRVYKNCGFKVMDEVVLGKGVHAASGELEKGGPGIKLYAMLWKPEDDGSIGN